MTRAVDADEARRIARGRSVVPVARALRLAASAVAVGGAVTTLAILVWTTTPWEAPVSALRPLVLTSVWMAAPYLVPAAAALLVRNAPQGVAALLGAISVSLLGTVVYVDALVRRGNPLHALVLLAVPPVQWALGAGTLLVVGVLRLWDRRRTGSPR
jgi:hypothetical protein